MLKQLTHFLFLACFSFSAFSQKEANFWYFGNNAGFDFSSGTPVGIAGALNTPEGCSTISDRNGNLLFYTDGVKVWNKNNIVMPNGSGLLGIATSSQSALIIRKPGSETIYYIFTADGTSSALNHHMENGYRYSMVDMTMDGGLGDITAVKNILLYAPSTEKLSAVKQADGVNIWLMTHEWNSSKFRAYSITCNGIDTNAVISDVGIPHQLEGSGTAVSYAEAIGQMKFSPNGKRLALAVLGQLRVQIFDFDNLTGMLSNPINIVAYWPDAYMQPDGSVFDFEYVYGVEFSPDGHLLYLSCLDYGNIYQYDLTSGYSGSISSTGIRYEMSPWCTPMSFGWTCPGVTGALQLGPDEKIYGAFKPNLGLNVIADPNIYGTGCTYVQSPALINPSNYGLPGFMASYFDQDAIAIADQNCLNVTFQTHYTNATSYLWSFGDPDSATAISTDASPSYTYADTGHYNVTLVLTNASGCTDTIQRTMMIKNCEPIISIPDAPLNFPNVFSPNDDGVNDSFIITGLEKYPDNEVVVYDRWGIEVFHKKGCTPSTSFTGNGCVDGVYYYTVVVSKDAPKQYGYVTIVR